MPTYKVYVERVVYERGSFEVEAESNDEAVLIGTHFTEQWNESGNDPVGLNTEFYYDHDDPNWLGYQVVEAELKPW